MKSNLSCILSLIGLFIFLFGTSLRAEDWTTTDGKVYQEVSVIKVAPDAVTILHHDGGALVPLANLPPDIQERFHYDPAKAQAAIDARTALEAENALLLQAEQMANAALAAKNGKIEADETNSNPSSNSNLKVTHFSMDNLAFSAGHQLFPNPADPTHHSMDSLLGR